MRRKRFQIGHKGAEQRLVGTVGRGCETEHRMRAWNGSICFHIGANIDFGHECILQLRLLVYRLTIQTWGALAKVRRASHRKGRAYG